MPRHTEDPVKHVISFRVNHEENVFLKELAESEKCSISDFLRRNLQFLADAKKNVSFS